MEKEWAIPVISAGAAVVAALAAWWSARLAQAAETRAIARSNASNPLLQLYLVDAFRFFDKKAKTFIYAFSISVRNVSEAPNCLNRIELELHCHLPESDRLVHILQHDPARARRLPQKALSVLQMPSQLLGMQTVSGWALFEVPAAFLEKHLLDRYRINLPNSRGAPAATDVYLVKEVHGA